MISITNKVSRQCKSQIKQSLPKTTYTATVINIMITATSTNMTTSRTLMSPSLQLPKKHHQRCLQSFPKPPHQKWLVWSHLRLLLFHRHMHNLLAPQRPNHAGFPSGVETKPTVKMAQASPLEMNCSLRGEYVEATRLILVRS